MGTDDHDGTGCVVGDLLTDRSEEETGEAASPAAADDDEIGTLRRFDKCAGRRGLPRQQSFDRCDDPVRVDTVDGLIEHCARAYFDVIDHGAGSRREWRCRKVRVVPGMNCLDACAASACFVDCPRQRALRTFRPVDADDDARVRVLPYAVYHELVTIVPGRPR